jgi:Family of unknown function (DUF5675)
VTDFVLTRVQCDPTVTIGELKIGPLHICWTCEDCVREIPGQPVESWKIKGQTAIPFGRYKIERTFSNRFGHTMPQLLDVPGFEGIRIHPGNSASDTEGCILPGLERRPESVGSSQLAYREILKWLDTIEQNNDDAWIEIKPCAG